MYYVIHFEFYDGDKHLNITKFITEQEAINRLLYLYFNNTIILDLQRHTETKEFILNCQCFKYNIEELLEKYKEEFTEQENEILNKIKQYKQLYYNNSGNSSYIYIGEMHEDDLVLDNYDFELLKKQFKIKSYICKEYSTNFIVGDYICFDGNLTLYKFISNKKKYINNCQKHGSYYNYCYIDENNNQVERKN
jgi:hypothetical protein